MASQTPETNSKSKKPKCTTLAIWQESILIQQMNERFKEHKRDIHFLKSRIELLEGQVAENSKNANEITELKKKVGEHEREMSVVQEIITSLQSQYKDSVYQQDGSGVWKRLGLDKFTGIPPTKALLMREIRLINLKVEVSTLLRSLGQCKRLKKLTLVEVVLRGGEGKNTGFRQCLLDLLNNCSPDLEVYGTTSVKPFRMFAVLASPSDYFTADDIELFDQNLPHQDPPSKYLPHECQALVISCDLPRNFINDFTIHFKVTRLILEPSSILQYAHIMEILEQIRVRKNDIEYILLELESKPRIRMLDFPVAWTPVLQEAGYKDNGKKWYRIVFEKQLDSTWKARNPGKGNEKEIDRIMIDATELLYTH